MKYINLLFTMVTAASVCGQGDSTDDRRVDSEDTHIRKVESTPGRRHVGEIPPDSVLDSLDGLADGHRPIHVSQAGVSSYFCVRWVALLRMH